MSREALHLEGVRKRLGSFELDIPELTLARGYVLGLIGRNGAGKTTTLNIALNLVHPDAGRVMVLGMEQPGAQMEIKRRVGQLSETPVAYEDVSLRRLARMVGSFSRPGTTASTTTTSPSSSWTTASASGSCPGA